MVLSQVDVVEPDLLYIARNRFAILTKANVRGAPDLVVEILSPGTRGVDETAKRKLYERTGVKEYWILDPELDVVRVYRRGEHGFGRPIELSAERADVLTTPLLVGWSVSVGELFVSPF
ncbi:MAG TPA: Uma2 family endonuclease [Gemmatimonadales bacterium]|nr:Uma2 family endonuclease [Gemmatimonadales bacterium]